MGLETPVPRDDERAVEILARDLPLHHGLPLVCDATLASPLTAEGALRPDSKGCPGTTNETSERRKENKYPELVSSSRVRFLVLAGEVGGRWNDTALQLVRDLAYGRAATLAPPRLQHATAMALQIRWWGLVAVAAQDALAATLLGDAPHLLTGQPPELPLPLGDLLLDGAEAPAQSRLPLR